MLNLVISVVAIGLFALVMTAGMGYINFSKVMDLTNSINIEKKLKKIELSISSYQTKYESLPASSELLLKNIRNDFRIDQGSLSDVVIFDESMQINSAFDMYSGNSGYLVEICFGSEALSKVRYDAIMELNNKVVKDNSESKITVSDTCGSIIAKEPLGFPTVVWTTYRIK